MRVRVAEGWAVVHEGKQVSSGELEVADDVGKHWCSRGWATEVKAAKAPTKAPRR